METVSVEIPLSSSPSAVSVPPEPSPPKRDPVTGRFPAGTSGNPAGRPLGSPNKARLVKQFIEEKLTDKLDKEALAIMQMAVNMAKKGDRSMIKLLLGDMMAPTRQPEDKKQKGGVIQVAISITNLTTKSPTVEASPIAEATFTEVSE